MHWFSIFGLIIVGGLLTMVSVLALIIGVFIAMPIVNAAMMFAYEDISTRVLKDPVDQNTEPATRKSGNSLLAALIQQRIFTWACTGVTVLLLTLNAVGLTLWACPFQAVTGLPCPGCGMTRSCMCLMKGDVRQSFHFHLFGPLIFLIGVSALVGTLLPSGPRQAFVQWVQKWDHRLNATKIIFWGLVIYSLTRWLPLS